MLSDKFESAIVKLCQDIEDCPIKTIYFEQWFLRNIVRDFLHKANLCATYEMQLSCPITSYMHNAENTNFYEQYEMILEKKQCSKFMRDLMQSLNNAYDTSTKEAANFYDMWAQMIIDDVFDFVLIKKYPLPVQQHFMSYYFVFVIKNVCLYNDVKLTDLINKNLKNMAVPELFSRMNRNINRPADIYTEYYDIKIFTDVDKYILMIHDLRSYLFGKKSIKSIDYTLTDHKKDHIVKQISDTLQYMCDLANKDLFCALSEKILIKEYITAFSNLIYSIKSAYGSVYGDFNEIFEFTQFINAQMKDPDFDFHFNTKLISQKIADFHILPNKALLFLNNLCECVLHGEFNMDYIINTKMFSSFVTFYNKHVKINIVLHGDKYKKLLNDTLRKIKQPCYTNSTPINFDLDGTMDLYEFVETMNLYTFVNGMDKYDHKETVTEKTQKSKNIKSKIEDLTTDAKPVKKVTKKTKEKIPAAIRNIVWHQQNGDNALGKCFCCKVELISKANFECGHIVSEKHGGSIEIDNLRPICGLCNKSMGTCDMHVFMEKHGIIKSDKQCVKLDVPYEESIAKHLNSYKNDDLKKICKAMKMTKTVHGNKNEYVMAISDFLNKKTKEEILDIFPEISIKKTDTKTKITENILQFIVY